MGAGKVGLICGSCWSGKYTSGSGSVIGRDPLPPRAVSTSLLTQNHLNHQSQSQSHAQFSSQSRVNVSDSRPRQQAISVLPVHQSTPQPATNTKIRLPVMGGNEAQSSISRVASNGDVRISSPMMNKDASRISSPSASSQRLISPAPNFGVISPISHRVSSPSDSDRHTHSSSERIISSPINMREMNGDSGSNYRQNYRMMHDRESAAEYIQKRSRMVEIDTPRRMDNLQKLDDLKKHLIDLEKQYEKGKPLVNLVDNMVKLGTLYNRNAANGGDATSGSRHDLFQTHDNGQEQRDRIEFNQRIQEQRLLTEERRDWNGLSPDHGQLQAKVHQLYKLDRIMQEESGTLHSLQQDKVLLEKALGGLRHKLEGSRSNPLEAERYKKQQILLERELSRVRKLLAHNSKKLEDTVAENTRLEQELVILRQKIQSSRRYNDNMAQRDQTGATAILECELRRVQSLVGDLQRQRQELSIQVRQLTEKSHNLVQQIRPNDPPNFTSNNQQSANQIYQQKKRNHSSWLETDLDSGMTFDHGLDSPSSSSSSLSPMNHSNHITLFSPQLREQIHQHQLKQQLLKDQMQGKSSPIQPNVSLYVNTDTRRIMSGQPPEYIPPPPPPPPPLPLSTSDINTAISSNDVYSSYNNNGNIGNNNRDKQEIKTVRIVKRESERRQRDRGDRNSNIGIPLMNGHQMNGHYPSSSKHHVEENNLENFQLHKVLEEPPINNQVTVQYSDIDDMQFQRSMSLPRGFGGQKPQSDISNGPVSPPPRSDSMNALRNMMARCKSKLDNHERIPDNYPNCQNYVTSNARIRTHQDMDLSQCQLYPNVYRGMERIENINGAMSPTSPVSPGVHAVRNRLSNSVASINSVGESPQLSPVFKSEAARQIIKEMTEKKTDRPRKRQVPKEKRRHYTVSSSKPIMDLEDSFSKMGMGRARDDLDMERALRPRINAPDVVRSTLSHKELKYNESTIDQLLGTPNKIFIPERYVPEQTPELSAEEKKQRLKKADAIRKMLSETTVTASEENNEDNIDVEKSNTLRQKVAEEKKQRDHILQLNQILAKQVMEKSKMVAVKALTTLPLITDPSFDDEDLSPQTPLPLYQQRDNFYS